MADIKLFEIGNGAKEYKGENVALEKELQNIIEKNMDTFFGVTFLASEYSTTDGGRMDSIGIDENNCPVIFEYKRSIKDNVRVRNIILNEKYKGDALLQKKFVSDHLTKAVKRNHGELPMYYIVEKDAFDKATEILEKNRRKAKTNRRTPQKYTFTSKIKCNNCGKNYKRKIYNKKIYWMCQTYDEEGRDVCSSKQISEEILMSKVCEALGINDFSETLFNEKIKQIIVPENGLLTFAFHGRNEVTLKWENKSRSESWSEEKRQMARERAINFLKKGN